MTLTGPPIPLPPKRPSKTISPEQIKAWGPVLVGLGAVIAALGTSMGGCSRTDLGPLTRELTALREELRLRDARILRNREGVDENKGRIKENRDAVRATDSRLDSLEVR